MQKVQINKISEEIEKYIELLAYNGLNLISKENVRQIEFFLQNASQVEAYRLATSLRYLNVELERFLQQSTAFNTERYIFFLCNCWLLSRSFKFLKDTKDEAFYHKLIGQAPQFQLIEDLKLRLGGIEKIFLEGAIFGVILYFISLMGKTKGKILKWNIFQPSKGIINPDVLLTLEIPQQGISFKDLFDKTFNAFKLSYSEKDELIALNEEPKSKIVLQEKKDYFPLKTLERYDYDVKGLYSKISTFEYTPFDLPTSAFDYILVKNLEIVDSEVEGEKENIKSSPVYIFKLNHKRGYPLYIRLQDKHVNQGLIEKLMNYKNNRKIIENLFGRLVLERGQLSIFPLCVINENIEEFISVSEVQKDYREIMKTLYKK